MRKRRRAASTYAIAKKALKKVNKLASAQEIKHYDLDLQGPQVIGFDGLLANLNAGINAGTSDTQRIGDKIKMLGTRLHYTLDLENADRCVFRLILLYDKENTLPNADDFLSETGNPNVVNSPFLVDERHKFIILHDKKVNMSIGAFRRKFINFSKKINKMTQYVGGTTTVSKGILRLWIFSDVDPTDPQVPSLYEGFSRVYYADS